MGKSFFQSEKSFLPLEGLRRGSCKVVRKCGRARHAPVDGVAPSRHANPAREAPLMKRWAFGVVLAWRGGATPSTGTRYHCAQCPRLPCPRSLPLLHHCQPRPASLRSSNSRDAGICIAKANYRMITRRHAENARCLPRCPLPESVAGSREARGDVAPPSRAGSAKGLGRVL